MKCRRGSVSTAPGDAGRKGAEQMHELEGSFGVQLELNREEVLSGHEVVPGTSSDSARTSSAEWWALTALTTSLERQEQVAPCVVNAFWVVSAGRFADSESGASGSEAFRTGNPQASAFPFVKRSLHRDR